MSTDPAQEAPRVLLCIPNLRTGGAERQVRLLAPLLVRRGIALSLFGRLATEDVAQLTDAGIACFPIRARGNHNPLLAVELARAARAARARLIHTWLTQMDILGGLVALATRRRWLLSERAAAASYSGRAKGPLRARLGRHADAVIANSQGGLDAWPDHRRRLLVPNAIDHDEIAAAPLKVLEDARGPLILSVARFVPQKRLDRLLRAVALARNARPDLRLVLLGEGPEERALKALAAELGMEAHIRFAGVQPDPWSWLKAADLFVMASGWEGHPNAVLEAAAAGVPMLLSDIPPHREAMDGGALYADPEDPAAFAAALLSLLRDPGRAQALAALALEKVRPLTVERAADRYAEIYRETLAARPPRA
jgi:glycosyltransferase involved in cell wall biosynthesis